MPEVFTSGVLEGNFTIGVHPDPADAAIPFVCFFSGHVAITVIVANHLYLHGQPRVGVFLHALNVLQIGRLLATRGHYSIDIMVGWIGAIYVVNPAEKLG